MLKPGRQAQKPRRRVAYHPSIPSSPYSPLLFRKPRLASSRRSATFDPPPLPSIAAPRALISIDRRPALFHSRCSK
ncbi:hypothetical protein U9M48_007435 [Paspalum notatum var. saurae]|uniref:Uncharacterized protein n=1 Tax=Paspalum notatum var. saurae TaxID=547442 RepID=A0AAQ3PUH6_PASNO